jgi:uncharacterized protein YndB with AHSA1/START domain
MSVKKDLPDRRYVEVEIEVPGTPEQVWQTIATGPGISSWFVPTQVDERVGGSVVSNFGPGMESVATVTEWSPPARFAAESADLGPEAPKVATEWIVEARSGSTCIVRVVHSLFTDSDTWDNSLESWEGGWPGFFKLLKLVLTHFPGRPCSAFRLMGMAPGPEADAWKTLTDALGITGAELGQRVKAKAGAPPIAGVVERVGVEKFPSICVVRIDEPAPGIVSMFAMSMGGSILVPMDVFLYGDEAAAVAAREEPVWREWLTKLFPPPGESATVAGG